LVDVVSTDFPFVQVPAELHVALGKPVPGTRIYRKIGPQEEGEFWMELVEAKFGRMVSPGGVSMFAPVSRAAVHKRMKEGKLTCFSYNVEFRKRNIFGRSKKVREKDMSLIPVSECKAWAREIEDRAIERGVVTREELEGDKPDWYGRFLEPDSRWEKRRIRAAARKR
jgi:hypothetical protein